MKNLTSHCQSYPLFKFNLLFVLLLLIIPQKSITQTVCDPIPNPCAELDGPIFPGGRTLCERNDDFSADITIPDGRLASQLLSPTFNGKDIVIAGTFYIDVPTAFYYCRVRIAPGGRIIVTSEIFKNDMLTWHSVFFSCSEMWEGIVLETGTRCRFYYSEFEDAQHALTVNSASYVALFRNIFNRNFIGIRNAPGNTTLPFLLFKGNVFDCTRELSEPFDLEYDFDYYDKVSFAGIYLNNCSSSVGFMGAPNTFQNLNYGIAIANKSTVNIKDCRFFDAQKGTIIPNIIQDQPSGAGVIGLNSDVIIIGDEGQISSQFTRADLFVEESNLLLTYATFEDASATGSGGLSGQLQLIEQNSFNAINGYCIISFNRSAASGEDAHTIIRNNSIVNSSDFSSQEIYGIHINGKFNPTDIAFIDDNTISISNPCTHAGIRHTVAYSENAKIRDNMINFYIENIDWEGKGIYNWGGTTRGVEISGNNINAIEYEVSDPTFGIFSFQVRGRTKDDGVKYCFNTTNNLSYGLAFQGNCTNSQLFANNIDTHNIGLNIGNYLGVIGVIGPQNRRRNEWLDESNNYDSFAAFIQDRPDLSLFKVNSTDALSEVFLPDTSKVHPSTGWFEVDGLGNNFCAELEPEYIISHFDSIVIIGGYAFDTLASPVKFLLKKEVINVILENSSLTSTYADFLDDEKDNTAFKIAKAEVDLKKAFQIDLTDQSDLDSFFYAVVDTYDRLFNYDSINYANIDTITLVVGAGLDSILSILSVCSSYREERSDVEDVNELDLMYELDEIYKDLDTISTSNEYEERYRFIYMTHIKFLMGEEITYSEDSTILEIANMSNDSSQSNLLAYRLFNPCGAEPELIGLNTLMFEQGLMESNDKMTAISFLNENIDDTQDTVSSDNDRIELFDITGKLVWKSNMSQRKPNNLDFSFLPSGLYYQKTINNNLINGKLIFITQ